MSATRQDGYLLINDELDAAGVRAVQRRVQAGELHRLARGIATSLPEDQWPALVQREKLRIAAALFPGAVVGFRSAFEAMVGPVLYLSYSHARSVELPGLRLIAVAAPPRMDGDTTMAGRELYFPSQARMFLDNMTRNDGMRNVSRHDLEQRLAQICESAGEGRLRELRDDIERLGLAMGRERSAAELSKIIGAILGSRPSRTLQSTVARALANAYDPVRVERFDALANALRVAVLPSIADMASSGDALIHFAFLESYFSNFIEGTEFEVSEARQIVLEGKIAEHRPKDSHDIVGVFEQIIDPGWRLQTLASTQVVLTQLSQRHARMMRMRPEVHPGEFKQIVNRAGNTVFVEPRLVSATLLEGARRLHDVPGGLARALYAMFVVSEVHPFDDGNGRLARLVMNAELSAAGECRVIVPTLYRETYLDCLRVLTRQGDPAPFIKGMVDIQRWSAGFDYEDLDQVVQSMRECNAFERSMVEHRLLAPPARSQESARER